MIELVRKAGSVAVLEVRRAATRLGLFLLVPPLVATVFGALAGPGWLTALDLVFLGVVVAWLLEVFDHGVAWWFRARTRRKRRGSQTEEPRSFDALVTEADDQFKATAVAAAWYHLALVIGCVVLAVASVVATRYPSAALYAAAGAAFWLQAAKKNLRDSR